MTPSSPWSTCEGLLVSILDTPSVAPQTLGFMAYLEEEQIVFYWNHATEQASNHIEIKRKRAETLLQTLIAGLVCTAKEAFSHQHQQLLDLVLTTSPQDKGGYFLTCYTAPIGQQTGQYAKHPFHAPTLDALASACQKGLAAISATCHTAA